MAYHAYWRADEVDLDEERQLDPPRECPRGAGVAGAGTGLHPEAGEPNAPVGAAANGGLAAGSPPRQAPDGAGCESEGEGEEAAAAPSTPPTPPSFPESKRSELQLHADNVKKQMATHSAGVKTYKGYWSKYDKYHEKRFGTGAPRCAYTGVIWLTRELALEFTSHMASSGATIHQVTLSPSSSHRIPHPSQFPTNHPLPTTHYPLPTAYYTHYHPDVLNSHGPQLPASHPPRYAESWHA